MDDRVEGGFPAGPATPVTASEVFPQLYDRLRSIAARQMARKPRGHSLQATALVHEAYLRLTAGERREWNGTPHSFAAVAEAMRRILIKKARRKHRLKRGGHMTRREVDLASLQSSDESADLLLLDDALSSLARVNSSWSELIKLRFFIGLTIPEAARVLGVSPRTTDSWWASARAHLRAELSLDIGETGGLTPSASTRGDAPWLRRLA